FRESRIGLAVAEALAGAGARVFLSSRRPQNVRRALEQLRGRGLQVRGGAKIWGQFRRFWAIWEKIRKNLVGQALAEFGAIDILVSNAAVNPHLGPALEADERTWDKVFQVNVTATAMLVRLVAPHMERRGGGAIVVMSSIAGYQPMAYWSILVFLFQLWQDEATRDQALAALGAERLGSPQDVAQAVLFLVSPQAAFVAGQTLLVAGGARPRL
uniref:dehydrogenase/reductase SDR family member 4-like n=1 Tax=Lonchura striata TaxID=40157 RepID=UPI0012940630